MWLSWVHKFKSAITHMNNSGDSLEPWGVPMSISFALDNCPDIVTICCLLSKYDISHLIAWSLKPYIFIFETSISWLMQSKAALRSSLYTIKENLLTLWSMFSEHTAPIGTYNIPIDSDFHGDGPCQIWAPGIDRVISSMNILWVPSGTQVKPALYP